MDFYVINRNEAENGVNTCCVPHIIISVHTPGDKPVKLKTNDKTLDELHMCFYDLSSDSYDEHEWLDKTLLFNATHADEILAFVRMNPSADAIIVHCDAGLSRSPAIAGALSKIMNNDDTVYFKKYHPNTRVYKTILKTYYDQQECG